MKYYSNCESTVAILRVNPINLLWCLLSLMVSGMAIFSFLQPFWLIEPTSPHYLGVYSYCVKDSNLVNQDRQICGLYGGQFSLHNLPSLEWRITCVLFGSGCLIHLVCALLALGVLCACCKPVRRRAACCVGFVQAIAVIFSVVGLLLFPMGFNSNFVKHYCSFESRRFNAAKCEAGWGLLLAVMGTSLSIFCPILAQFYDVWMCEKLPVPPEQSAHDLEDDDDDDEEAAVAVKMAAGGASDYTIIGGGLLAPQSSPLPDPPPPPPLSPLSSSYKSDYTRFPSNQHHQIQRLLMCPSITSNNRSAAIQASSPCATISSTAGGSLSNSPLFRTPTTLTPAGSLCHADSPYHSTGPRRY